MTHHIYNDTKLITFILLSEHFYIHLYIMFI